MASLRETKDRISSVRSTLKITSAMKLVASSKLRKAQKTIEALRPYEATLNDILSSLGGNAAGAAASVGTAVSGSAGVFTGKTAIVALSSNTSLCGGFNAGAIKKAAALAKQCAEQGSVEMWPVGRKMAEAMRKEGYVPARDLNEFVAHPSYADISAFAASLAQRVEAGELDRVLLVYNHFVSTSRQEAVVETFVEKGSSVPSVSGSSEAPAVEDFIVEPSAPEVVAQLEPQVLNLKMYAAVLDSVAAEHAARTVAMQTATDNAKDLLADLTLEYNKGRQQKITSEILDLVGGAQQ